MTRRLAGECFLGGVLAGFGVIGAFAVRTAWAVIRRPGGPADFVRATDIGANRVH